MGREEGVNIRQVGEPKQGEKGKSLTDEDLEALAEKMARKVVKKQEEKKIQDKEKIKTEKVWEEGKDFLVCKPCSTYGAGADVPQEFNKSKRGLNGGLVGKRTANGEQRAEWDLRAVQSRHCESNLHKWCVRRADTVEINKQTFDEGNEEVGKNVIRAFLKNIRRGLGSEDFLADVDLLHNVPGVPKSQKNNSRSTFFELRNDVFEVVTASVQEFFRSGEISEISVTLDKVTVQHRSYTVVITFFFYMGSLYCLLNELLRMKEGEYDARGTVELVAKCLMSTLGLTRTQLASILLHFRSILSRVYCDNPQ